MHNVTKGQRIDNHPEKRDADSTRWRLDMETEVISHQKWIFVKPQFMRESNKAKICDLL